MLQLIGDTVALDDGASWWTRTIGIGTREPNLPRQESAAGPRQPLYPGHHQPKESQRACSYPLLGRHTRALRRASGPGPAHIPIGRRPKEQG